METKIELTKITDLTGDIRYYIYVNGSCEYSKSNLEDAEAIYEQVKANIHLAKKEVLKSEII